jgi:hypothetical protein
MRRWSQVVRVKVCRNVLAELVALMVMAQERAHCGVTEGSPRETRSALNASAFGRPDPVQETGCLEQPADPGDVRIG